ncbi:MAG: DNA polymerase III subunit beta [Candidatus Fraserbacteria bacterium RBG_16_55_9]|uniref:Beta sliding clamp n=1 Tax=Fraserbacteria sp. (strain RBG_16_55_9) TaxID=1817864 RepID=A0A1F5UNR1_FRAXR|nr:MAG: DNA polymerase III subunit beta [Candidatus Fraserbacteria bacterium RBG_16_55_9]
MFGVKTANRALGSTLPILAGIKLEIQGSELRLLATDLERALIVTIPIESSKGKGTCVINGQLISKITGMLPDEELKLRLDDAGDKVEITSGEATFELLLLPATDYPEIPALPGDTLCVIQRERLVRALERTTFAAMSARETSRLNLTGVDILTRAEAIKMVATNGYRLALKEERLESGAPEGEYLIDADALKDLQSILGSVEDEQVKLAHKGGHLFFATSQVVFIARVIQEEYPDFERVIPRDNPVGLHMKREVFLNALQRAEITTAAESGAVVLEPRDSSLLLKSSSAEKGHTEERIPLLKPAGSLTISFRGEYLIEALRRMSSSEVVLWLKDSESAGLLEPTADSEEDQGFLYVCMPIRMD